MMKLKDKIEEIRVLTFGNRINFVAGASALCFLTHSISELSQERYKEALIYGALGAVSLLVNVSCEFGTNTLKTYIRAKEHILRNNELSERFANVLMRDGEYCDRQGLYLAAKRYGQIGVFSKVSKERGRIPCF